MEEPTQLDFEAAAEDYKAGRGKMEAGSISSAIVLFERSVTAFPHFKTLELLGECRLLLGQPLAAVVPLAAAVGLGTNEFRATYLLAKALSEIGLKREALKHVERALAMNPNFASAKKFKKTLDDKP